MRVSSLMMISLDVGVRSCDTRVMQVPLSLLPSSGEHFRYDPHVLQLRVELSAVSGARQGRYRWAINYQVDLPGSWALSRGRACRHVFGSLSHISAEADHQSQSFRGEWLGHIELCRR